MKLLTFIVFYTVWTGISAQEITVRAMMDTNKALIGDQIKLQLTVDKPVDGWNVQFPDLKNQFGEKIEIISVSPIDSLVTGNGRQNLNQHVVITVFDTGYFEIPPIRFAVKSNNFSDTISTIPVGFDIFSVKADSAIHDIKSIYKASVTLKEFLPWMIALIILAILMWLLIFYVKRRKDTIQGKMPVPVKREIPSEPAHIIALRDLEKIRDEKPWLNNKIKYYYIRISEILRLYIERQFSTPALEQTTDEILRSLKPQSMDQADLNRLTAVLKLSDLVKFAKVIPDAAENSVQVEEAIAFVTNTGKVIEPGTPVKIPGEVKQDLTQYV